MTKAQAIMKALKAMLKPKSAAQKEWGALDASLSKRSARRQTSDAVEDAITAAARPFAGSKLAVMSRVAEPPPAANKLLTGQEGHRVSLRTLLGVPGGAGAAVGGAYAAGGDRLAGELEFEADQQNWFRGAQEETEALRQELEARKRGRLGYADPISGIR